ncbi:hypothetical protein QAD02_002479 [Eretmocerus hayati]|uniref:Uncharacterized protein n=1 Tax=Eretmocerus hayati TaxID=131215 RepID=A0ACC2NNW4_9HYME|nr:hypothetical protein QAD02_002479 [Eretmocerus hayati]
MDLNLAHPRIEGRKLFIGGCIHVRSRSASGKTYWDCGKVCRGECKARAITRQGAAGLVVLKGSEHSAHTHPPDQGASKAEIVKINYKSTVEEHPELPPAQILRDNLGGLGRGVLVKLPERESLKKSLRRERRHDLPPNPK